MARTTATSGGRAGSSRRSPTKPTGNGTGRARTNGPRLSPTPRPSRPSGEVQRFGTLRLLPIALSAVARTESAQILNRILADTTILYALYKKHHWVVAGPTFYQLHLLFDKHAEEQLELIDLLAERVQTLGAIAVGDPRHAAELTTIERAPNGAESVADMITRTLEAHELIIEKVRRGIEATEKNGDWGSNDLLMSDVLRRNEIQVWFISEHIVDMPLVEDD
ncbi:MAG TPA: DNA starvation/stationary phase protection protein [Candidatus Limnocylindrales bacterium]|nr:DNA starvation/stationary phase protection protein [Candidatus Limnocylindrales bacterium]